MEENRSVPKPSLSPFMVTPIADSVVGNMSSDENMRFLVLTGVLGVLIKQL